MFIRSKAYYLVVRINVVEIYLFTVQNLHTANDVTSCFYTKNNYAKFITAHTYYYTAHSELYDLSNVSCFRYKSSSLVPIYFVNLSYVFFIFLNLRRNAFATSTLRICNILLLFFTLTMISMRVEIILRSRGM